jgi:LysR family hydrogen peroxide-inducible transcriptional activator
MNIRDLRYLVALVEHNHFGKAAEACFVSQPALSMQIKKLEEYLGVKLLERTNKSVRFTEIGMTLGERARNILSDVDELHEMAKSAIDPYSGILKLGIFPTLAPYLLPHIIPSLAKNLPKLSLYLIEEKTSHLLEKLNQGKIDAAILGLPIIDKGLSTTPLFDEEFYLGVPHSHALAKRKIIKQTELENRNLLLLEDGHCLRDVALALCYQARAQEAQNFRATSLETLRHMVAAGVGITLIPKLAYKENDGISYVPFNSPKPMRSIGIVWRTSSTKILALNKIAALIKKIMVKGNATM